MNDNGNYPVTQFLSTTFGWLGWMCLPITVIAAGYFFDLAQQSYLRGLAKYYVVFFVCAGGIIASLTFLFSSEMLRIILSIERNIRIRR